MLKTLQRPVIFVCLEEHRDFNGIAVDVSLYFPATDEYMLFRDFLELTSLPGRYKNVNTELMKGLIATLRTCGLEYEDTDRHQLLQSKKSESLFCPRNGWLQRLMR